MINITESGHPVFRGSSALERGDLKNKRKGHSSIHFCGDDEIAEVVLHTFISVNQLSICGAVADMCDELAWRISGCSESTEKLVAPNNSETMVMSTELSTTNKTPRQSARKLAARLRTKIRKSSGSSSIDQTVLQCRYHEDRGKGTVFHDFRRCGTGQIGELISDEKTVPRHNAASKVKGWIRGNTKIGPALEVAVSHHQGRYGIEIMIESLSGDGTCSWVDDREWNKQIRDGNDGGNPREPHR